VTGDVETGVYDAQDRIDSYGDCDYSTDAAGFLISRDCGNGVEAFTYDARGVLRQATTAQGNVINYVIDPQGRRIGRRVNGTLDKGWLYRDGLRPVAQINSAGQVEAVFVFGTHENVPDYIIEKASGGDVLYRVIADHLGTPRRVVRATDGVVVHELDCDEWGRIVRETGSKLGLHPFGFAGGLRDRATGMIRFGARDYDPYSGRWTARDPILFGGGQANLYVYVNNDPINRVDPSGLDWLNDLGGGVGAIGDFASEWQWGVRGDGVNDKFYHCMANCRAAARGPGGEWAAEQLSNAREGMQSQPTSTSADEDQVANRFGRDAGRRICKQGGDPRKNCVEACVGEFGFTGNGHSTPRGVGSGGSGDY
jgi:RHS repeat-associated protein